MSCYAYFLSETKPDPKLADFFMFVEPKDYARYDSYFWDGSYDENPEHEGEDKLAIPAVVEIIKRAPGVWLAGFDVDDYDEVGFRELQDLIHRYPEKAVGVYYLGTV